MYLLLSELVRIHHLIGLFYRPVTLSHFEGPTTCVPIWTSHYTRLKYPYPVPSWHRPSEGPEWNIQRSKPTIGKFISTWVYTLSKHSRKSRRSLNTLDFPNTSINHSSHPPNPWRFHIDYRIHSRQSNPWYEKLNTTNTIETHQS